MGLKAFKSYELALSPILTVFIWGRNNGVQLNILEKGSPPPLHPLFQRPDRYNFTMKMIGCRGKMWTLQS